MNSRIGCHGIQRCCANSEWQGDIQLSAKLVGRYLVWFILGIPFDFIHGPVTYHVHLSLLVEPGTVAAATLSSFNCLPSGFPNFIFDWRPFGFCFLPLSDTSRFLARSGPNIGQDVCVTNDVLQLFCTFPFCICNLTRFAHLLHHLMNLLQFGPNTQSEVARILQSTKSLANMTMSISTHVRLKQ